MNVQPPQWATDLCNPKHAKSLTVASSNTLPSPPGFKLVSEGSSKNKNDNANKSKEKDINGLQVQKAWELALQPAKSIPMNMIMSYMSGTSLQIIPIMTALMLLSNPIKSVLNIRKTFRQVLGNDETYSRVIGAIFMYIVFQAVLMAIGVHKLNSMGLIPNTRSDWLAWEVPAIYSPRSYVV